jgi:integrase
MWIAPFRRQVKLTTNDGWNMLDSRGKMRLQVREEGRPAQSVTLPYDWSEAGAALALPRIQQIFKRYVEGKLTLAKAAQGADTASSAQQLDWPHLFREYRQHRPQASEATWQGKYLPVLKRLADVMEGRRPRPGDGTELCMAALEHWEQGSRQRQIMRQNLGGFLRWAVERGHLKPCYLPPANLPEVRKPKRVGFALSDAQILRLLEGLPSGDRHDRWRFAIQLCAVYGLRPEELRYLRIKDGPDGQELWTIYRKSKGGRSGDRTEPRRLHPLLVRDLDGTALDWNLQGRVAIGERLPPLGQPGKAGEALLTYLRRLEIWMALKADAAHQGEALVPYTFRHRYAKASHAGGLPIANIAAAMGHTVEVHLVSYARFAPDATADLYAQLNAGPRAELGAVSAGQSVGVKKAVRTTRS